MTRLTPLTRRAVLTAAILGAPRAALACPVCFGQNDSPLAWAVNVGVFVMLGFVAAVLGAFATFFVYLARRARLAENAAAGGVPSSAGPARYGPTPQEGNAQC